MEELGRPLRFTADWGMANFYRIFGWVAHNLYALGRSGLSSIDTSQAWVDAIEALAKGTTDVTIATPTEFAVQAREASASSTGDPSGDPGPCPAASRRRRPDRRRQREPDQRPRRHPPPGAAGAVLAARRTTEPATPAGRAASSSTSTGSAGRSSRASAARWRIGSSPFAPSLLLAGHADVVLNEAMMLPDWKDLAERLRLGPCQSTKACYDG